MASTVRVPTNRIGHDRAVVVVDAVESAGAVGEHVSVAEPARPELHAVHWADATPRVRPPTRSEKFAYLSRPQHRWLFWLQAGAFIGLAISMFGMARNTYWTLLLLPPLLLFFVEQILSLWTSTFRRRVTLDDHLDIVTGYDPTTYPSIDVFLPTAGEPTDLLSNSYRYVRELAWPGPLRVLILDDAGRREIEDLAAHFGFDYLARPGSAYKKAGNLQYALDHTTSEHIAILDADFVPRRDYLLQLMPYMDDESFGIVQSPQYFATEPGMSWLERSAGATQEMFYRFIQPSRDAVGAAVCVGTSAIYRRTALESIGGFPQIGHSEDVYTGVEMSRRGFALKYVPVLVSCGKSPDDLDSFVAQQYRWCEGSMSMMVDPHFHQDDTMTLSQRTCYWSGFLYYISTALNAVLGPLVVMAMVWFFPDEISSRNVLPLLGALAIWLVVYPAVTFGHWRFEVLRVQAIYGFAHLFCILDLIRGRAAEWIPTNMSPAQGHYRSHTARVRWTIAAFLCATQVGIAVGLAIGAARYGLERYWANVLLGLLNAYVFVPVAWLCLRAIRADREKIIDLTPSISPVAGLLSALL